MAIIKTEELAKIRKRHQNQKIIFCSGVFDLLHPGHIIFFETCKKYGQVLVVALATDKFIKAYKGKNRPILNENMRLKMVDSLKAVDYCLLVDITSDGNQYQFLDDVFSSLKPDLYILNNDVHDVDHRIPIIKKHKIKMKILGRDSPPELEGISTTRIIEKIKNV